jgi:hypothetical protein
MQQDRRSWLRAAVAAPLAPLVAACGSPLPVSLNAQTSRSARTMLDECAAAHGLVAFRELQDVSVAFEGQWRALIGQVEPALVDPAFSGKSEERFLPRERLQAGAHVGTSGRKHIVRQASLASTGEVRVWFNGEEARDSTRRSAAAFLADRTAFALLGPLWLAGRSPVMEISELEWVEDYPCDVLNIQLAPGLGMSRFDQIAMFIDRKERLVRRLRFALEGLQATRNAIAEIETYDYVTLHGVRWPTRFYERLVRPIRLPLHDWNLTGLDVNRGFDASDIAGPEFTGKARAPAARPPQLPTPK